MDARKQKQQMNKNSKAGSNKGQELKRRPVLDAVFESITRKCVVDVALPIANDNDAFLNVARRLESGEHLELHELRSEAQMGAVMAMGRLVDAFTGKSRTWRLRVLLATPVQGGGSRR